MNTQAHALIGLYALSQGTKPPQGVALPAVLGGILPDSAMVVMRCWAHAVGYSEEQIREEVYYMPLWTNATDVMNSLPLLLGLAALSHAMRWKWARILFLSMSIHSFIDLLVHNEDAHRHFYPFSDWRFISPVSYRDPKHYGVQFGLFEMVLVRFLVWWLWKKYTRIWQRVLLVLSGLVYPMVIGYRFVAMR